MVQFTKIIDVIDAHTCGEPVRVITSGLPQIPGETMNEKKKWAETNLNSIRNLLMREPRGHRDMFGVILTPPVTPDGDIGYLYMQTTDFTNMCGHLTIGATKVLLDTGMLPSVEGENKVHIDTPAGRVTATASVVDGKVSQISFLNVPSFLYADKLKVNVPDIGEIEIAISYGGDFYIFVNASDLGLHVRPEDTEKMMKYSMWLKEWGNKELDVKHPGNPQIRGIYGVIVHDPDERIERGWLSRETCCSHPGSLDRSPCGTGTSAHMALLYGRKLMTANQVMDSRSILDTKFVGSIERTVDVGGIKGIIPRITGSAWISGFNQLVLDPDDPLKEGFLL